jgi:hypothetical protein
MSIQSVVFVSMKIGFAIQGRRCPTTAPTTGYGDPDRLTSFHVM